MQENEVFVIDLTSANTSGEIINSISLALEIPNASGKKIFLKLKDTILNKSQLLSIQSLISSYGSVLSKVETQSLITYEVCEGLNIPVTKPFEYGSDTEPKNEPGEEIKQETTGSIQTPDEFSAKSYSEVKSPEELFADKVSADGLQAGGAGMNLGQNLEELRQEVAAQEATVPTVSEEQQPEIVDDFMSFEEEQAPTEQPQVEAGQQLQGENLFLQNGEESIFGDPVASDLGERKTISVYKKANEEEGDDYYEEVDFYAPPTDEPVLIDSKQTIYVTQTLRSGQILEFDGNIIIIGDCHPGSEIKASGDITVWGVLGSIAHAGIKGNKEAKIRALKMHAVQLRIADCYSRRPDGDNIPYIVKSHTFTPEEARIVDNGIVLFKI